MALACLGTFASCEDDRDDNPTLVEATEFVLNVPAYATQLVDLATSTTVNLVCSQPNWSYPMSVTYVPQVSVSGSFTTSNVQQDLDESGEVKADYYQFDPTVSCNIALSSSELAKAITYLNGWEDAEQFFEKQKITVRLVATPNTQTAPTDKVEAFSIISNSVDLTVATYYVELKDAPVVMWYLVGNMFGGKWGSVPGETALPMFMIPDFAYDKKDGSGDIQYLNYFETADYDDGKNESGAAGFKIQPSSFNWDLGLTGDNCQKGAIIFRNKGEDGGHIVAPDNGFYKITVNTNISNPSAVMEEVKFETAPKVYDYISVIGLNGDWENDIDMIAYNKDGVENHAWMATLEVAATTVFKFRADHAWDTNWGFGASDGEVNLRGTGVGNGCNIGIEPGKWVVSFNDITGDFSIISVQ